MALALNTGSEVPLIGLGTWLSKPDEVRKSVKYALENGYRHIDCAYVYCNEDEVGQGIRESGVSRKDIFITSKVWNTHHRKEYVKASVKASLKALGTDYLDLYLIHWPISFVNSGTPEETPVVPDMEYLNPKKDGKINIETVDVSETWKAMEELVEEGLVKSIGLSNFNIERTKKVLSIAKIKPSMNQVELHPALQQPELVKFCQENGIAITAYSPLGNNVYGKERIVDDPIILQVAKKLKKSPAQVCISFAAQRGVIVIPKSVTPSRITENFQDFILPQEDFDAIASLELRNVRYNDPGHHEWSLDVF